jgi:uncharacterized membrane protein YoaK (UPF0700 family)
MTIKALMVRVGQSLLLVSCLATVANAFVAPSIGRACNQKRPCSLLPNINSIPLPRTNSISVNSAETTEPPSPFAKLEKKRRLATGMAFLTGVANLALFMKYKTFATMMTGNTMWMALAMIEQRYMDVGYYASVIASYLAGLSIFRRTDLSVKEKTLPICAFLVATLFVGSDLLFKMYQSRWVPMMMLAMGFGIINSVGQEVTGTLTFVITGHMTRLTNQVIDRYSRTAGRKKLTLADKQFLVQNIAIISGFFGGAAFAGVLKAKGILMEKIGVFSGIGLAYAGLFLWKDIESLGGAWWNRKDGAMCDVDDDGKICSEDELEESQVPTDAVKANN